jgi:hypothetical protein
MEIKFKSESFISSFHTQNLKNGNGLQNLMIVSSEDLDHSEAEGTRYIEDVREEISEGYRRGDLMVR